MVTRAERAWEVLGGVLDPEVPALSVRDLGIVREVIDHGEELEVVLTPTYSGCPATEVIEQNVLDAIRAEGLGPARATLRRAPAWTTDWITEEGKRKLNDYGIAPPHAVVPAEAGTQGVPIRIFRRDERVVPCPRCGSQATERLSAFGSTACKAMYRCLACREPFEHFKPL
ncbi:1,2-phenylacetyl-CoA epoxidase subunit PaaD [Ramlibacter pallidus]|uniref:1,2-phenylacetyl-CoA epoxidase subunit PaaD n=1 Tax=Ramlibacter pallidus TaxID=2780087 RepID=UPI00338D51D7